MYRQPLKVSDSGNFLGVDIDNHLSMKLCVEHIERASLISRVRITRLNSINESIQPINPSLQDFYQNIHGLGLYCSECTQQKRETKIRGNSKPLSS